MDAFNHDLKDGRDKKIKEIKRLKKSEFKSLSVFASGFFS